MSGCVTKRKTMRHTTVRFSIGDGFYGTLYTIFAVCTAMIGFHRHASMFWAIVDFFLAPIAWIKWLVMHQVNLTAIKETFAFFLQ